MCRISKVTLKTLSRINYPRKMVYRHTSVNRRLKASVGSSVMSYDGWLWYI